MALTAGTRLGSYEIIGAIGSGGMGDVYRARDSKLDRVIALKVLPAGVATDPDRRARFEREAKAIAALNHPNIVTIHAIEEIGDVHFLTMELVEGRTLEEIIPREGLPLGRLFAIAIPLADAVSAAHQRGITHRDLKPANIMVGDDGRVKVLDFGLAKLREDAGAIPGVSVATGNITAEGHILGTVAYMSPEQAEGRPVDERSDLFSLGIVLYQMATGRRPFGGDTNVSIISSIIKDAPPLVTEINTALPKEFGRTVRRCLVKDPEHRYQSAKDLRNALEELKQELDSGAIVVENAGRIAPRRPPWVWAAGAVLIVALAVVAGILGGRLGRSGAPASITASFTQLTSQQGIEQRPSLSPDGKWIVYESAGLTPATDIFLQSVGGQTPINLTKDSTVNDSQPAFSPDGEQIAFRSARQDGGIFVMGRTGEFARRVSDVGYNPAWSPDGRSIVYSSVPIATLPYNRTAVGELSVVDVAGGQKRQLYKGDAVEPSWSPHGNRIAFWAVAVGGNGQRDIFTIPAAGGEPVAVTNDAATDCSPVWSPDGAHLYFSSDRGGSLNLWRVPIDEGSGRVAGPPEPVTTPSPFLTFLSLSADGRKIAYTASTVTSNIQRFAFDPVSGTTKDQGASVTTGSTFRAEADVSSDGQRIAYRVGLAQEDIMVSSIDGSGAHQLTNDAARDRRPKWSPDGRVVAFYSERGGRFEIWTIGADGAGLRPVTEDPAVLYSVWSPDGAQIAGVNIQNPLASLFDPRKPPSEQRPERLPAWPGGLFVPSSWSSDGRRLAGWGTQGAVFYDIPSRTYEQVTNSGGGSFPAWLGPVRHLYLQAGHLMLLDLKSKQSREVLSVAPETIRNFSLSGDGRQLVITRGVNEADIWMATIK
jgi:serine/threonine protein kinase